MSKASELLVSDKDGARYVAASALMHPMMAFADGLSVCYFGKSSKVYLPVQVAIDWVAKELENARGADDVDRLKKSMELLVGWRDAPESVIDGEFRFNNKSGKMEPV